MPCRAPSLAPDRSEERRTPQSSEQATKHVTMSPSIPLEVAARLSFHFVRVKIAIKILTPSQKEQFPPPHTLSMHGPQPLTVATMCVLQKEADQNEQSEALRLLSQRWEMGAPF